jgi:hypothetical protein
MIITLNNVQSQIGEKKVISITDARKYGVEYFDTTTVSHKINEVQVNISLGLKSYYPNATKDTTDVYNMHFFKIFENKIKNYHASYAGNENFDKVEYIWLNDTTVTITLINSLTKENKSFKLVQTFCKGCSAGLILDDGSDKK